MPIYLASDALKSRSFRNGKKDMFKGFAEKFEAALGNHVVWKFSPSPFAGTLSSFCFVSLACRNQDIRLRRSRTP